MDIGENEDAKQLRELENLKLSFHDKKKKEDLERQVVDHKKYQNRAEFGDP